MRPRQRRRVAFRFFSCGGAKHCTSSRSRTGTQKNGSSSHTPHAPRPSASILPLPYHPVVFQSIIIFGALFETSRAKRREPLSSGVPDEPAFRFPYVPHANARRRNTPHTTRTRRRGDATHLTAADAHTKTKHNQGRLRCYWESNLNETASFNICDAEQGKASRWCVSFMRASVHHVVR